MNLIYTHINRPILGGIAFRGEQGKAVDFSLELDDSKKIRCKRNI